MSVTTELQRLQTARDTLRAKAIDLGIADSTAKLDALATAYSAIENKGSITAEVKEGETYTIPKGYHDGSGTVSGVAGGGNYSLQSKTVTPTKQQQAIVSDDGFYGLSDVVVKPIPEIYQDVSSVTATAADVLATKVIVDAAGVVTTGTMANNGAVSKTLDVDSAANMEYTVPAGYHNGEGKINIVAETKSATPTKSAQTIAPTSGKVLSSVTVAAIPDEYQVVTNVTAGAADVLVGKVIVDAEGNEIDGTMANNGAVSKSLDTTTTEYTVPAGYHNGEGKVSITTEEKSATPTKSVQTISPSAGSVISKVTVAAIPDAYQDVTEVTAEAEDVLAGEVIVAADGTVITGTMANNGAVEETIDTLTTSYTIPKGYHDGTGSVSVENETKAVTPTKSAQTIKPSTGKVLAQVDVAAIPDNFIDTTDADALAGEILLGKTAYVNTTKVTGSMPNNGAIAATITGMDAEHSTYTIPAGYTSGGTVSLTNDIELALAAI